MTFFKKSVEVKTFAKKLLRNGFMKLRKTKNCWYGILQPILEKKKLRYSQTSKLQKNYDSP